MNGSSISVIRPNRRQKNTMENPTPSAEEIAEEIQSRKSSVQSRRSSAKSEQEVHDNQDVVQSFLAEAREEVSDKEEESEAEEEEQEELKRQGSDEDEAKEPEAVQAAEVIEEIVEDAKESREPEITPVPAQIENVTENIVDDAQEPPKPAERAINHEAEKKKPVDERPAHTPQTYGQSPKIMIEEMPKPAPRHTTTAAAATPTGSFKIATDKRDDLVKGGATAKTPLAAAEKSKTNVEVLTSISREGNLDQDGQPNIKNLLAWAKGTKKSKTETMKVREKKRVDNTWRAVNLGAMEVVIEGTVKEGKEKVITNGHREFKVSSSQERGFQVRKTSTIQPVSETVVTREWIERAVKTYEKETNVTILDMEFSKPEPKTGNYQAVVKAGVGTQGQKVYRWIITPSPRTGVDFDPTDKETFILIDLGAKISDFVASNKITRQRMSVPYRPVIMCDSQYAILEDLQDYKLMLDDTGFNLDHIKKTLKAMAKLHAMSYAYFNNSGDDVQSFSEALKMIIAKAYQPSAPAPAKEQQKTELTQSFERLLLVIRAAGASQQLVDELSKEYKTKLYDIFREANSSVSNFSVLCHGFPTPMNINFLYDGQGRPVDVKFTGFAKARYAHAVVDLHLLMATTMGPKIEQQGEYLLRFEYHETLAKTMKALGAGQSVIPYDTLKKDYKKKEVYGCLAGAMYLASLVGPQTASAVVTRRASGKRVFESKILGRQIGNATKGADASKDGKDPKVTTYNEAAPARRALVLCERVLKL